MPSELARRIAEALDEDVHDDFCIMYVRGLHSKAIDAMAETIDRELKREKKP
jgi:hypothetical protein